MIKVGTRVRVVIDEHSTIDWGMSLLYLPNRNYEGKVRKGSTETRYYLDNWFGGRINSPSRLYAKNFMEEIYFYSSELKEIICHRKKLPKK